jgi:GNAT superfamily N-acetyltransferase
MIRRAETDADLAAYAACWAAVWPEDPISVDFILDRVAREPERLYLLAEDGPRVVATGCVARSSRPRVRPMAVAVVPERRRKGLGSRLLDLCLDHARSLDASSALSWVREDDADAVRFGERRGFVVTDRVVSLALDIEPGLPAPAPPAGIEIAELGETQLEEAYLVFVEGVADIPASEPGQVRPFDEWAPQLLAHPLTLVALDRGKVVGYADLELRNAGVGLLDNNLTTVLRSHRRRGIAEALKRAQIAWASEHGYRRVITATHAANEPMRRLNEKLGYHALPALLDVSLTLDADGR